MFVSEDPTRRNRTTLVERKKEPRSTEATEKDWSALYASALAAVSHRESPVIASLPPSCMQTAFVSQSASLFWDFYVPKEAFLPQSGYTKPWLITIQECTDDEAALRLAFRALACCRLGKQSHDERLIHESERLYSQALWELQRALWDEEKMYKNETLLACMLLSLYEVLEGSAQRGFGYLSHTSGANRLLELRGPARHISGQSHALFLGQRLSGIIHGLTTRKSSFLRKPEWLTVPWLENDKDLRHQLLDLMVDLPYLTERFDALPRVPSSPDGHLAVLQICSDLDTRFQRWYAHAQAVAPPNGLYWTKPASPSHNEMLNDNPFPMEIDFPDNVHAQTMMLYWSGTVLLFATLHPICRTLRQMYPSGLLPENVAKPLNQSTLDPFNLPRRTMVRPYASNIASSIEYFLQPDMRALGTNMMSFPVGVASYYFRFFAPLEPRPPPSSPSPPISLAATSPDPSPNGVAGHRGSTAMLLLPEVVNPELQFFAAKFAKMRAMGFSMGDFLNSLLEDVSLNIPKAP